MGYAAYAKTRVEWYTMATYQMSSEDDDEVAKRERKKYTDLDNCKGKKNWDRGINQSII